jgi:hypothetical protein
LQIFEDHSRSRKEVIADTKTTFNKSGLLMLSEEI